MARTTIAFTNFTAGELSPRLDGRTDLSKYFNGCKTLENMVVHPHGAATRRPGTKFIHEVKTRSKSTRLNSSHTVISYAVFCLKKKNITHWMLDTSIYVHLNANFY